MARYDKTCTYVLLFTSVPAGPSKRVINDGRRLSRAYAGASSSMRANTFEECIIYPI